MWLVALCVVIASIAVPAALFMGPGSPFRPSWEGGDVWMDATIECKLESIEPTLTDGRYSWNITARVTRARQGSDGEPLGWGRLEMALKPLNAPRGYVDLVPKVRPTERYIDLSSETSYFYLEKAGRPLRIDEGDLIGVANADRTFEERNLELYLGDRLPAGSIRIPRFDQNFTLELGPCDVVVPRRGVSEWDAVMTVTSIDPPWERVDWGCLRIEVGHRDDARLDITAASAGPPDRTAPHAHFTENGTVDGCVDVGEALMLTGVPAAWRGQQVTVWVGGILYLWFDMPAYYPCPDANITLGDLTLTARTVQHGQVCDAHLTVTSVDPLGQAFYWTSTTVQLKRYDRYWPLMNVTPTPLPADLPPGTFAYYVEASPGDARVSVGDTVVVTGLDQDHVLALVAVVHDGTLMGGLMLPDILVGLNSTLHLGLVGTHRRVIEDGTVWDVTYDVTSVDLPTRDIPWSSVNATLYRAGHTAVETGPARVLRHPSTPSIYLYAYYEDVGDPDSLVTKGDRVVVECVVPDLEDGILNLAWGGLGLANVGLPRDIRSSDLSEVVLSLGPLDVRYAPHEGADFWRLTLNLTGVTPTDVVVLWRQTRLYMYYPNGDFVHAGGNLSGGETILDTQWSGYTTQWLRVVRIASGDDDPYVTAGDAIGVAGLPSTCAGGRIEIQINGRLVATIPIPPMLPRG